MDVQVNCTSDSNTIRKDPAQWDVYASAMVTAPTGDPENFFTTCALDNSVSNNGHYHSDKLEELAKEMGKEFDVENVPNWEFRCSRPFWTTTLMCSVLILK